MERVIIEVKDGVVIGVSSTQDIEVYIIDYDTEGMSEEDLIEYSETIKIPSIVKCGKESFQQTLDEAEQFYLKEAENAKD